MSRVTEKKSGKRVVNDSVHHLSGRVLPMPRPTNSCGHVIAGINYLSHLWLFVGPDGIKCRRVG